jgi:hypothetical protein
MLKLPRIIEEARQSAKAEDDPEPPILQSRLF